MIDFECLEDSSSYVNKLLQLYRQIFDFLGNKEALNIVLKLLNSTGEWDEILKYFPGNPGIL